ncbi:LysR family transcriptional regulator [Phenylobacterium sp.]|uniref:LysR family transcriptional regulator n=1 Tax=Phenylobacterium sp. TaxID=1871053 RepID=UPI002FCAC097
MFDWNDLRAFLAVARGGSTLAAAKVLGINQTTVARRIEALEANLGLKLFERTQSGSRLTEAGQTLVADADGVERAAEGFAHQAQALQRGMAGSLRVTVNEILGNAFLTPALMEFRRLYPEIRIDTLVTDAFLDLDKGEADVAIRGTAAPLADSDLISRKLSDVEWAVYCSRDYAIRHGVPTRPEDLGRHVLIGGEGSLAMMPVMQWIQAQAPDAEVHTRSSSLTNLMVASRAGLGIAPLPVMAADQEPELCRCMEIAGMASAVYVMVRADMKDVRRVRVFIDFLAPHFAALRRTYEVRGEAVQAANLRYVAEARAALAEEA